MKAYLFNQPGDAVSEPMPQRVLRGLASSGGAALAYALACCLGSQWGRLPNVGDYPSFWPAAAIALVTVLWRGSSALPGLLLGRLLFDALPEPLAGPMALGPGWASALQAVLAAGQAGLGAWAIQRWVRHPMSLVEPGPILRLLALAGASSLLCGSYNLLMSEPPSLSPAWVWLWLTAVTGDLLGVLLLVPVLLLSLPADPSQPPRGARVAWLWLATTGGYLMSWAASAWVISLEHQQVTLRWEALQTQYSQALQAELSRHEQVLVSLASVLGQTRQIDPQSFAKAAQPLLSLAEGLYALSWSPVVPRAQRASFEAEQKRGDGRAQPITERGEHGLVTAASRDIHVPVQATEPLSREGGALGFDLYSDPLRQAAIHQAVLSRQLAATQRIRLVQDGSSALGMMVVMPVAWAPPRPLVAPGSQLSQLRGLASAVVHMDWLAAHVALATTRAAAPESSRTKLESPHVIDPQTVAFRLLDADAPEHEQTLWSHNWLRTAAQPPSEPGDWPLLGQRNLPPPHSTELLFAGRHYRLESQPLPDFWSGNSSLWPYLVFTAGLWMAVGISLILLLFTGYQQSLAQEVEERTVDLLQVQYSLQDAMGYVASKSDQLGFVLEQTPVGFLGFDETGRQLLGNQAMARMLDIGSLEETPNISVFISLLVQRLPGISLHRLFALGQPEPSHDAPQRQLNRVRLVNPNGQIKHITLVAMTFPVGPVRHLFTVVDLSSDVALESSKSEFLSLVAHEIRTPLTSVLGYAELLRMHAEQPVPQRQELAGAISAHARQIQGLLSKMLNLSELEVGGVDALKPQLQDLHSWCPKVLRQYTPPPGRDKPELLLGDDALHAMIDPRKLERALHELLSNAYAFSAPGQAVQVQLQRRRAPDGRPRLSLAVLDQGQGMDEAQLAQACDKFYRVDKSGEKPGCGLGLPLVKLITELHHGQLQLSPGPGGQGLVAAMVLPLSGPA
ncbi:CHASE domain-containing protein [Curvibacter sp. HBC28]|uniref:histidine kinase n=1 Tax=Curvibacter microcysteis TaxID=3026419 RepID=A0ABT5MHC2_9BURK|nr:CHASE domain-containing protein [Curvibacter sp. HBC28]MDD0815988.1 CHASE domain-containing protein [Curvibacter sp. HBC28]